MVPRDAQPEVIDVLSVLDESTGPSIKTGKDDLMLESLFNILEGV